MVGIFSSNPGKTTSVAKPFLGPDVRNIARTARGYFDKGVGFNSPDFRSYVPMSWQTKRALGGTWDLAKGGADLAGAGKDALLGILGSDPITPEFRQLVDTEAAKLGDDVTRQFGGASFGGADHATALTTGIGDFRNRMIGGQYNQGVANQISAIGAMPTVTSQEYLPYEKMALVGGAFDDLATRTLQARTDRFNTRDMSRWNRLGAYQGAVNGGGGAGTTTSTITPPSNPFGGAAGGALLGYQMGGIPGALLGGGAGLLSNIWSDERLKEDVTPVGKTDDGLPIYTYRYKPGVVSEGASPVIMGVMAQDAEKTHPEAVATTPSGLKTVNYALLGGGARRTSPRRRAEPMRRAA